MKHKLTSDYISHWAWEQQLTAARAADLRCGTNCRHEFHGFPCPVNIRTGPTWGPCPCRSSADGAA